MIPQQSSQSDKHVCIFELQWNSGYLTSDVVCTICGLKLSSVCPMPVKDVGTDYPQNL